MNQRRNIMKDHVAADQAQGMRRANLNVDGTRILVADDSEDVRNLHAAILDFEGYEVSVAANGADALEQLSTGRFHLLLTDRQMPVMGGESLVLAMRAAGIHIPVVMISGSLAQYPLCKQVAREVALALPKPIPAASVLAAVFLALHRLEPSLLLVA